MRDDTKPLLSLDNGESLVSSPRGDEYWRIDQTGEGHKLTTIQAVRYWIEYEKRSNTRYTRTNVKTEAADQQNEIVSGTITVPERVASPATQVKSKRDSDMTSWQNDLLERLGLDVSLDEAVERDRAKRKI